MSKSELDTPLNVLEKWIWFPLTIVANCNVVESVALALLVSLNVKYAKNTAPSVRPNSVTEMVILLRSLPHWFCSVAINSFCYIQCTRRRRHHHRQSQVYFELKKLYFMRNCGMLFIRIIWDVSVAFYSFFFWFAFELCAQLCKSNKNTTDNDDWKT